MPANLVFRRKIWGARDNGIPPRSTPASVILLYPNSNALLHVERFKIICLLCHLGGMADVTAFRIHSHFVLGIRKLPRDRLPYQ